MHEMRPHLIATDFPPLIRSSLDTMQANLGYRCNQTCIHCHVGSSPHRTEEMSWETMEMMLRVMEQHQVTTLDMTGGAPEMNPHFRQLVQVAREQGVHVMDRCNLTILNEPGYEWLANFLAENQVEVVASLPCYLEDNVDKQRGKGVFQRSIEGLQQLNELGYGRTKALSLSLVFNPQGPVLPPEQSGLEAAYKNHLKDAFGVEFTQLFTLANMPIKRFGSTLISKGEFDDYMALLKGAFNAQTLPGLMCKSLISVDWQGFLYDCDFNQQLEMPLGGASKPVHIAQLADIVAGVPIRVAEHCYGCTAGQGSSCGGALAD